MPWGHRSIARAIFDHLDKTLDKKECELNFCEVFAQTGVGGELYSWAYRNFPAGNRVAVKLTTLRSIRKMAIEYSYKNIPDLTKMINKYQPDLIISAYFLHSQALVHMKQDYGFTFDLWTVVADPWSINTLSFVEGAQKHIIYDKKMRLAGRDFKIPADSFFETGWWTRPSLYKKYTKKEILTTKTELGLEDNIPTIFVGGGSLGTSSMSTLLPILLTVRKPLQVIFNTGKDESASKTIENFKSIISKLPLVRDNLYIVCLGWIEDMARVLSCCDIVLGKAGPNFMFDVIASEKLFVSITHIGGQEDGNLDILRKKRLGLVAEDPIKMARLIRDFVKRPEHYKKLYASNIAKEAGENKKSLDKIVSLLQK